MKNKKNADLIRKVYEREAREKAHDEQLLKYTMRSFDGLNRYIKERDDDLVKVGHSVRAAQDSISRGQKIHKAVNMLIVVLVLFGVIALIFLF